MEKKISQFETLVNNNIQREGVEKLLNVLRSTDFYLAPASTKYHDSEEGGLVNHSMKVFQEIIRQNSLLSEKYSLETLTIVSLFHDLCKVGFYKVDTRNTKDASGKWVQVPYYTVDDKFPYGHGEKSVYMLQEFIKLTPDEALAIRWHMNGFEPKENHIYMSKAYEQSPLAVILAISDLKASYIK